MEKFDATVFIGRFQPIHIGHLKTIQYALSISKKLILIVGSHKSAPSGRQPWSTDERIHMMELALSPAERKKISFVAIRDRLYTEIVWNQNILQEVYRVLNPKNTKDAEDFSIALVGHDKDATSYYLKNFPHWKFIDTGNYDNLNSTDFRKSYFLSQKPNYSCIPKKTKVWLEKFRQTKSFQNIKSEMRWIKKEKSLALDTLVFESHCLVLCGNYILLTKRKSQPGRNLFSLPGGTLNENEEKKHGAHRYLKEQTNIQLAKEKLDYFFTLEEDFNYPQRNPIYRSRTRVFFYQMHFAPCPNIHPGGEAKEVHWIMLDNLPLLENQFYSDHYQILQILLGRIFE